MAIVLAIIGWGLFGLAVLAGLVLDLVGLFGNWVILAAVAGAWLATGFQHFGAGVLLGLAGLAVLGEIVETAAAALGAAKFGGGKRGAMAAFVGSLVGAVVGTPWFPVVGTILGACIGAFVGAVASEFLNEQKQARQAL